MKYSNLGNFLIIIRGLMSCIEKIFKTRKVRISARLKYNVAILLPLFGVHQQMDAQNNKPNIILLMADDLGYGDVGFNGNSRIITPNLDGMAESGVVLTSFYAAAPLCTPSRASCLTGRAPFRQGIFAAHTGGMRHAETTIAEVVKEEGYNTGFFGKWHLGWLEPDRVEDRGHYSPPWQHGFDDVFATKSAVPTWDPTKYPENWDSWGKGEGDEWGGSVYIQNGKQVTENLDGDDSRIIMDRVIPFLETSINSNKPFLATVWFHTPHEPVVAGPEYLAMYPDMPDEQKHLYGSITAMDEQIGRLRSFLREKGIDNNTIVFFCSDNGAPAHTVREGWASNGPFRGSKHQIWEGGLRVPSLIEWPGQIDAGRVSDYQTSTNDYFPTILELLHKEQDADIPLDGISLLPLIKDEPMPRRSPLAFGFQRLYRNTERFALISGEYKIGVHDEQVVELYNLEKDPQESNNLAKEYPEILLQLQEQLEAIKESWRKSREGADYQW